MTRSIFLSLVFHSVMIVLTALSLPFMMRAPVDLPPILSVKFIQITDKTNIPFAAKAAETLEKIKKKEEKAKRLEDTKSDIGWGHQIRSYVLDQSRIKDLRTGVESSNTQDVLDGNLDQFIEASLKAGL